MTKEESIYKLLDEHLDCEPDYDDSPYLSWKGHSIYEYRYNFKRELSQDIAELLENIKQ